MAKKGKKTKKTRKDRVGKKSTGSRPVARSVAVASEAVGKADSTAEERAAYLTASNAAELCVADAIAFLEARKVLTTDLDESAEISVQLLMLQGELFRIRGDRLAYLSEKIEIVPPSPQDVAEVEAGVKAVAAMTPNAQNASAVLTVVRKVLEVFAQTRA